MSSELTKFPEIVVVGGPNGAGKTTFAMEYVAQHNCLYLGADAIAAQLSPDDPTQVQIEASREFLRQINDAISTRTSFVVESTLSGKTFQNVLSSAKAEGYKIGMLFVWVDSADTSVERVRERVAGSGHDVPEADIRRRFLRSICNFWNLYRPLSDYWSLLYNSGTQPLTVASGTPSKHADRDSDLFRQFETIIAEKC